jgi:ParB family chromosome partitioning protein
MGKLGRDVFFGTSPDLPKIIELDLDQIHPNPDQPRKIFNEEALQELAASIDKHGLIQPITVKRDDAGRYLLVAGERRYRAHQLLDRKTIPAIVTEGNVDEIALIENIQREDLNPLETAEALAKLMERYRYTQEEVGKVIGKAQNTVSTILRLNSLPEQIKQEYPTSDNVPKSVLVEISRLGSLDEQLKLWQAVKDGGLTVRVARAKKQAATPPAKKSAADQSLQAGRRFLRTLETLNIHELAADPQGYALLRDICEQVKAFAEALPDHGAVLPVKSND